MTKAKLVPCNNKNVDVLFCYCSFLIWVALQIYLQHYDVNKHKYIEFKCKILEFAQKL